MIDPQTIPHAMSRKAWEKLLREQGQNKEGK
jgi:hypothetical protein